MTRSQIRERRKHLESELEKLQKQCKHPDGEFDWGKFNCDDCGYSGDDMPKKVTKSKKSKAKQSKTKVLDPIEQGKRDWIRERAERNRSGYSTGNDPQRDKVRSHTKKADGRSKHRKAKKTKSVKPHSLWGAGPI